MQHPRLFRGEWDKQQWSIHADGFWLDTGIDAPVERFDVKAEDIHTIALAIVLR